MHNTISLALEDENLLVLLNSTYCVILLYRTSPITTSLEVTTADLVKVDGKRHSSMGIFNFINKYSFNFTKFYISKFALFV
jgi:hypothetical protein